MVGARARMRTQDTDVQGTYGGTQKAAAEAKKNGVSASMLARAERGMTAPAAQHRATRGVTSPREDSPPRRRLSCAFRAIGGDTHALPHAICRAAFGAGVYAYHHAASAPARSLARSHCRCACGFHAPSLSPSNAPLILAVREHSAWIPPARAGRGGMRAAGLRAESHRATGHRMSPGAGRQWRTSL